MQRIELDFVAAPRRPLGWSLLALGLLLAAATAALGWRQQTLLDARQQHLAEVEARLDASRGPVRAPLGPAERRALGQAWQVSQALATDWNALFAALEDLPDKDVALLALAPDPARGSLRIEAEARNRQAMLDYVQAVNAGDTLRQARLAEEHVQLKDPNKPLRFTLDSAWGQHP